MPLLEEALRESLAIILERRALSPVFEGMFCPKHWISVDLRLDLLNGGVIRDIDLANRLEVNRLEPWTVKPQDGYLKGCLGIIGYLG